MASPSLLDLWGDSTAPRSSGDTRCNLRVRSGKTQRQPAPTTHGLALAESLGQQINLSHAKVEENALVADAVTKRGNILISWEHEAVPTIAGQIAGNSTIYPQKWPSERFDLVWVFDRGLGATNWTFTQVPQMLLPGDVSDPIPWS